MATISVESETEFLYPGAKELLAVAKTKMLERENVRRKRIVANS